MYILYRCCRSFLANTVWGAGEWPSWFRSWIVGGKTKKGSGWRGWLGTLQKLELQFFFSWHVASLFLSSKNYIYIYTYHISINLKELRFPAETARIRPWAMIFIILGWWTIWATRCWRWCLGLMPAHFQHVWGCLWVVVLHIKYTYL